MAAPTPPATPTARAPRLCKDGYGQVVVGSPGRRYLPGHAWNAARGIDPAEFAPADLERFYGFIRLADNGRCWAWTGPRNEDGYGRIWFGTRKLSAHRVMWALVHGVLHGID